MINQENMEKPIQHLHIQQMQDGLNYLQQQ